MSSYSLKKILLILCISLPLFSIDAKEIKVMSFNIQYGNTKSTIKNDKWFDAFIGIVIDSDADIVLLQEVGSKDNGITELHRHLGINSWGMLSTESYFAHSSFINNKVVYSGYGGTTQENVIFFKLDTFQYNQVRDLKSELKFDDCKRTPYPTDFNNLQCVEFTAKSGAKFFVLNTHLRPQGDNGWKMKEGSIHARDTITLRKLLEDLHNQYSNYGILVGGDFNYSWSVLTNSWSDGEKLSYYWTVDPGYVPQKLKDYGIMTHYSSASWDHFICNSLISNRITNGISLAVLTNNNKTYVNRKWVQDSYFNKNISDHWPIILSFDLEK